MQGRFDGLTNAQWQMIEPNHSKIITMFRACINPLDIWSFFSPKLKPCDHRKVQTVVRPVKAGRPQIF
jgi:hypothetical protein